MKKIILFGDSLTDYFPMEKLKDMEADIINCGRAGDTLPEMHARLSYDVIVHRPDVVIMQGGANDFLMSFYRGYQVVARQLVDMGKEIMEKIPGVKVYIQSLYPAYTKQIGMMPSWAEGKSNQEIAKINGEIQRLCMQYHIEYLDVFLKLIGADGQLPLEYTMDGIHLKDNAYDIVAQCIRPLCFL